MLNVKLNILVALPSEAKPINQLLGLKRQQPDGQLPLYVNHDCVLVLTGHGMQAARAAVSYLHRCNSNQDASWLNIGIAGHGSLPVGQAMLASEVISPTDESWNMTVPVDMDCPLSALQTVMQPVSDYPNHLAYDMEAAGYVCAVKALSKTDKIHVLKVISDNPDNPSHRINAKMVRTLIRNQSALIKQLIERILRGDV